MPVLKPVFTWIGGKTRLVKKLRPYIPEFTGKYIEPFLGSGGILLNLQPQSAIVSDINPDIINVWNCVKFVPEQVIENLIELTNEFKNADDKKKYLQDCVSSCHQQDDITKASIFILVSKCSWNGRLDPNGKFKIQSISPQVYLKGRYFTGESVFHERIRDVSKYLNESDTHITCCDFRQTIQDAKTGDFVYLDPPYIDEAIDYAFNYTTSSSNNVSLDMLLEECIKLNSKGVKWMLSFADTQKARTTFASFHINCIQVYRISRFKFDSELVITNYVLNE